MKKFFCLIYLAFIVVSSLSAREGMWLPVLLDKYNIEEMQKMGFKLSARDIYDVNNASMKDAVVFFGSGCTGEMISSNGLLLTNHHCGMRYIQANSSVERNYLKNGFWAMSGEEELPNPGLKVKFLEYMKEVTEDVLEGTEALTEDDREERIKNNSARLTNEASENGKFEALVKPLFYGNQYYLYVYKVYQDVRLVGAPPTSIGKFGGNTDNWMWPRHTGDFALFRVYADENNEPAAYSPDNVPYKPKKHFKIALEGIKDGEFTMVLGNPGTTQQFIPSQQLDIILNQRDPDRIKLRDIKLKIIGEAMEADPKVKLQYAAKYASTSNAWKKWQGEIVGLKRFDAIEKKEMFEEEFKQWAKNNGTWENKHKEVFDGFGQLFEIYKKYIHVSDYYSEIITRGAEIQKIAAQFSSIVNDIENNQFERLEIRRKSVANYLNGFFKDYNQTVDELLFVELMPMLNADVEDEFLPEEFSSVMNKHDKEKLLKKVYRKSVLIDQEKLTNLLNFSNERQLLKLRKDPLFSIYNNLDFFNDVHIQLVLKSINQAIEKYMKTYVSGIMEMESHKAIYPDANLTMRVSYGKVEGYEPRDGVKYDYYTTLSGILEKDNQDNIDYMVHEKLKQLFYSKDFGRYSSSGEMNVCFIASNHTTGGNSGSPLLNGEGELVGINFDRCWEGTMSDYYYDPEICRNIAVDIRYVLFIIDKFAGAGYLLEEMEFVD